LQKDEDPPPDSDEEYLESRNLVSYFLKSRASHIEVDDGEKYKDTVEEAGGSDEDRQSRKHVLRSSFALAFI